MPGCRNAAVLGAGVPGCRVGRGAPHNPATTRPANNNFGVPVKSPSMKIIPPTPPAAPTPLVSPLANELRNLLCYVQHPSRVGTDIESVQGASASRAWTKVNTQSWNVPHQRVKDSDCLAVCPESPCVPHHCTTDDPRLVAGGALASGPDLALGHAPGASTPSR